MKRRTYNMRLCFQMFDSLFIFLFRLFPVSLFRPVVTDDLNSKELLSIAIVLQGVGRHSDLDLLVDMVDDRLLVFIPTN